MPTSWGELNDKQLMLYADLATRYALSEVRMLFFLRLMDMQIGPVTEDGYSCRIGKWFGEVTPWQMRCWLKVLDFLDKYDCAVRPERLRFWHKAKSKLLQNDVTFGEFLHLENWWYAYLTTREEQWLARMATVLYGFRKPPVLRPAEVVVLTLWYNGIKQQLPEFFPEFFRKIDTGESDFYGKQMMRIVDAEIRALTGGDVTKENQVMETPLWRALSELNAKTREADELKKIGRL